MPRHLTAGTYRQGVRPKGGPRPKQDQGLTLRAFGGRGATGTRHSGASSHRVRLQGGGVEPPERNPLSGRSLGGKSGSPALVNALRSTNTRSRRRGRSSRTCRAGLVHRAQQTNKAMKNEVDFPVLCVLSSPKHSSLWQSTSLHPPTETPHRSSGGKG